MMSERRCRDDDTGTGFGDNAMRSGYGPVQVKYSANH